MIDLELEVQRLMQHMKAKGYDDELIYRLLVLWYDLRRQGVKNVKKWVQELSKSLMDKEAYLDHWTEGSVALILASNAFPVVMYPFGDHGADLRADWQERQLYVEIARFREDYETRARLEAPPANGMLAGGGRGEKDVEGVYSKILEEARQLPSGQTGIVLLRSDNCRIEELEFKFAIEELQRLVLKEGGYRRLSAVFFDAGWPKMETGERFYLWSNPKATAPISDELAVKLRRMTLPEPHASEELQSLRESFAL